jgi:hypothetical protein
VFLRHLQVKQMLPSILFKSLAFFKEDRFQLPPFTESSFSYHQCDQPNCVAFRNNLID